MIFQPGGVLTKDQFAAADNVKCNTFYYRGSVSLGSLPDVFLLCWCQALLCTLSLTPLITIIISKIRWDKATTIRISSYWPRPFWLPDLLHMSSQSPIHFSSLCEHNISEHPDLQSIHLTAWVLAGWALLIENAPGSSYPHQESFH